MICRLCESEGADLSGRCWDCVNAAFNRRSQEMSDVRSVRKLERLTRELADAKARGKEERNHAIAEAENVKLREALKSSNIPALCQCSECRDLVEEFGKEKP